MARAKSGDALVLPMAPGIDPRAPFPPPTPLIPPVNSTFARVNQGRGHAAAPPCRFPFLPRVLGTPVREKPLRSVPVPARFMRIGCQAAFLLERRFSCCSGRPL